MLSTVYCDNIIGSVITDEWACLTI